MIISKNFVWTHFAKTGGYTVHKIFDNLSLHDVDADPLGGEWSDWKRHEPFHMRETRLGIKLAEGKIKIMTMRRLPNWLLSFAEFKKKNEGFDFTISDLRNGYIKHEKRDLKDGTLADKGEYDVHTADNALAYYNYESIDHWWRTEHLVDDVISTIQKFYPVEKEQCSTFYGLNENTNLYNKNIEDRFSKSDIRQMYLSCPLWAELEERIYGNLLA